MRNRRRTSASGSFRLATLVPAALLAALAAPLPALEYQLVEIGSGRSTLDKQGNPIVEPAEKAAPGANGSVSGESLSGDRAGRSTFRNPGIEWEVEPNDTPAAYVTGTAATEQIATMVARIGGVGTTTLKRSTQVTTHERPKPAMPCIPMIGATMPWYSAAAIPKLPSTSNPRPIRSFARSVKLVHVMSAATPSAPVMDAMGGSQNAGDANSISRACVNTRAGASPARKNPRA